MRHTTGCAVILNEDYHEDKEQRYFKSRINPLKLLTTDKTWLIAETCGARLLVLPLKNSTGGQGQATNSSLEII